MVALAVAWIVGTPAFWTAILVLTPVASALAWHRTFQQERAILDTPTSKVASAAQGYVELFGQSKQLNAQPVVSRLTGLPCLWFKYTVEQRMHGRWWRIDSGVSEAAFALNDDSGTCIIHPAHAEIVTSRTDHWTKGEYRFSESLLLPQDKLYVLGELCTTGGAHATLDDSREMGELLGEWKRNQPELRARFDLNSDGSLDSTEWSLARQAALREVRSRHRQLQARPGSKSVRRPLDGRAFVISNLPPERLARRLTRWKHIHQACFLLLAASLMVSLHHLGWR